MAINGRGAVTRRPGLRTTTNRAGRLALALLLIWPTVVLANNFCAVTAMGSRCHFSTLSACQQAIAGLDGQCVVNPAAVSGPTLQQPVQQPNRPAPFVIPPPQHSIFEMMQHGMEGGERSRRAAEEHQAKMRLLKAQTEAARTQPLPQQDSPSLPARSPLDRADDFTAACKMAIMAVEGRPAAGTEMEALGNLGMCLGLVTGVYGQHEVMAAEGASKLYCLPDNVTNMQMGKVVVQWVDRTPQAGHLPPVFATVLAFADAWPCR